MASSQAASQAASPAATANAKVSTPSKSTQAEAVPPPTINAPQVTPSPAPTPSNAQAGAATPVPSSPAAAEASIQRPSPTSQAVRNSPISAASPIPQPPSSRPSISSEKSIPGAPAQTPTSSSSPDSSPSPDTSSGSGNAAGPVIGSVIAVLVLIVLVVSGVWYLQRRRQKVRMRLESKRLRTSNFGLCEPGELIHEKRGSIEAVLEADLARLRSLDANISILVDDYDAKPPYVPPSPIYPTHPVPSLRIARKPSKCLKNLSDYQLARTDTTDQSPTKQDFADCNQADDEKKYASGLPVHTFTHPSAVKDGNAGASPVSVPTPEATSVTQVEESAHHDMPAGFLGAAPTGPVEVRQKSQSMNDFQQWCADQGHLEPASLDQSCWPQSPSIDSSNKDKSPLSRAVIDNFHPPYLAPLPDLPSPSTLIEFTLHNFNSDAKSPTPITLSVDQTSRLHQNSS